MFGDARSILFLRQKSIWYILVCILHDFWLRLFDFWLSVGWSKCNDKSGVEITVANLITTGVAKAKWNWLVAFCMTFGSLKLLYS